MKVFCKDVSKRTEKQIRNEVLLQNRAYELGVCPKILDTDYKTYIKMEHLDEMCIADMYGEDFKDMPKEILDQIYTIITRLYLECDIEYIDITPYNFIEKNGTVMVIDFGDAQKIPKKDWFLREIFKDRMLKQWNPDFR
jgi:tRNA A-37 threonylcarbamoyl transferase component Bud32